MFVALVLLSGAFSVAQVRVTKPQIQEKIDDNNLITLRGNTPPAATAANDRGRVNPGMAMTGLVLTLRRSPEQEAAFNAFAASQYDPNSPNFHHWLEPQEVGEKFGPALQDIAAISNWLSSHGLAVESVSKDRMAIRFSGSAGQVEETFHTEIHNLVVRGEQHISNMSDPQIPMALEPVVLGPKALHNFVPRPLHRMGGKVTLNKETGRWERIPGTSPFDLSALGGKATPRPELGIGVGSGTNAYVIEDVTPYDFATIYNVLPLWNNSIDGTGQTIAIAGRSDIVLSDVASFRSLFGLPAKVPNIIHTGTDPGVCTSTSSTALCTMDDQIENALDVEWSGAVAKGATIDLVVTEQTATNDSIYDSAQYVITNKTAPVINVSYGLCELAEGTSGNAAYNNLWGSAATEGIAVFVASGDSGSPSCDQGASSTTPYAATLGLSVNGIGSTPFNTSVGGTDFTWCNPTASSLCTSGSPYWGATNNSTTEPGANAQGYIPEVPWNDSCTTPAGIGYIKSLQQVAGGTPTVTDAESACNYIQNNWQALKTKYGADFSFFVNVEGAGGGASNCTTNGTTATTTTLDPSTCSGGYAKPSWQAGVTGIPNDSKRDIPDVSFFSAAGLWDSAYLICVSGAGTCLTSTSPTTEPSGEEIGGTSAATPAMAGVMALINQKAGSAQGSPNAELYALAAKQTYSSCSAETVTAGSAGCYFNDPDKGTNAMPCASGSPNCTVATTGDTVGVLSGFAAATGFDNATGLGSLNVANVVNAWGTAVTGTGAATVAVTANPTSFTSLQGTTVSVAVTGSSGTATGTIVLTSGSFTSASHTLAADGTTTFNLSPGVLAVGTDTITANYSGDNNYAAASGTTSVTVTAVDYTLTATTPAAVSPGSSASSTVTVKSSDGYAGSVAVTCALTSSPAGATDLPTCSVNGSPDTLSSSTTSATATVSVGTTAATSAALAKPRVGSWAEAGGGAVLALLVFFGVPARRRGWRAMLGVLVLILAFGTFSACGSGGGSSGGGGGNPGTTAGSYVFTVTGTGSPAISPTPTTTFTVTVN